MLSNNPAGLRVLAAALVATLFLSNCSIMRANRAEQAQNELVGMSKVDLYSCAGVPNRKEMVEDREFLTYEGGGDQTGYAGGGGEGGIGAGGVSLKKKYCHANVVLKDGRVEKVSYSGRTGGYFTKGEQCAFILDPCLSE